MAIDITNTDHRSRLSRAIRKSFTDAHSTRRVRQNLVNIYRDEENNVSSFLEGDKEDLGTLVNLFQKYVRGHLLSVAHNSPAWSVNARTLGGRGLDKRIKAFLTRYSEILNFNSIQKQLALDSAFGWAIAKVDNGVAPKGITAPVAPRLYRLNPDMFIKDQAAASIDECSYLGDIYLVALNEAQAHEGFDEGRRSALTPYRNTASSSMQPNQNATDDSYAEPMVRLIDVYIPKQGTIYTWPAPNDEFANITSEEPLGERRIPINPYCVLSLMSVPGFLDEISRLGSLRGLHLLANEMLHKGIEQARSSQRNPVGPLGAEENMSTALNAGDNNPIFFDESEGKIGMFNIPGPDAAILNLANYGITQFSRDAGNLEVQLGASTGADTARQTEALIGQINASQSLDRRAFEEFLSMIGRKLATLAFFSESLELTTIERVPGTKIEFSRLWTTPEFLPRVAAIDSFNFEVVAFSTAFRDPQERLKQLQDASQLILQWFTAKAQGAPVNLEAIMGTVTEAFDLLPELQEWWDGQEPTPSEQTDNTYRSLAAPPQGSDVRHSGSQGGEGGPVFSDNGVEGGVTS